MAAVHDVAVAACQRWVDQLRGRACPDSGQNKKLTDLLMQRSARFGLGLYLEYRGDVWRVSLDVKAHAPSHSVSDDVKRAGRIEARLVSDESDTRERVQPLGTRLSVTSAFPPLVVARTAAEASALWRKREIALLMQPDIGGDAPTDGQVGAS